MYIGRLGDGSNQNDGIYILLKEVVDNAVDEFIIEHDFKWVAREEGSTVVPSWALTKNL